MAQVLPYVPGFAEQLFASLQPAAQGLGSFLGGKMGMQQRKQGGLDILTRKYPEFAGGLPGQVGAPAAGSPMEAAQQQAVGPSANRVYTPLEIAEIGDAVGRATGNSKAGEVVIQSLMEKSKLSDKEEVQIRKEERAAKAKQTEKDVESQKTQQKTQALIDRFAEFASGNEEGIGWDFLGKTSDKGLENIGEFQSLRAGIEGALVPLVSAGRLTDKRFDFIMSQVPTHWDRIPTIRGKLRGLAKALQEEGFPVDLSSLSGKKKETAQKESKSGKEVSTQETTIMIKDPSGKIRSIPKEMVDQAIKAGGVLVQ